MSKITRLIILGLALLTLSVIIAFLIVKFNVFNALKPKPNYVAVYLSTGDIYFGRLSKFPAFKLSKVVFLQRDSEGKLSAQNFKEVVWKPVDSIYLEKENIAFWTYLDPSSPIVEIIEGKSAASSEPTTNQGAPAPSSSQEK